MVLGVAPAVHGASPQWQFQLQTDRHSDPLPLADLEKDDFERLQERGRRNLAYVDDEARLSRADGAWTWSLLARSRATLTVNRDAISLLKHGSGHTRAEADTQWHTEARLRGFNGAGLELKRAFEPAPAWRAHLSLQALRLARWRERSIEGPVQFDAARDSYRFDLRSSELNDRLSFPFQREHAPHGAGLLFGAGVSWQGERFGLAASVRDAGWLHWQGMPRQEFTLASDTQAIDADGFVVYKPLLQGRNRQDGLTAHAPLRWKLSGNWQASPDSTLNASIDALPGFGALPAVSWQQRWPFLRTELGWRFHERRATFGVNWHGWQLKLGTDRLGSGAHSRTLSLGYAAVL
ncbi:hypothetical protein [Caldimonas tepidiphila]|uniref:hypothetical protein n=1 Tax=Caldimonas tepidiphila TaxID=2315841 RepID=UPI000E5BBDCE|nr:hypothetical protein [Caldimonas tepidiphila]